MRTDIFDTGSETPEAILAKKRKLEAGSRAAAAWDGHADSVDAAVALEAQIRTIQATKASSLRAALVPDCLFVCLQGSDKMQAQPAIGPAAPVRAAPVVIPAQMMHQPLPMPGTMLAPPMQQPPLGGMFAPPPPGGVAAAHPYLHPGAAAAGPRPPLGAPGAPLLPEEQWASMVPSPFQLAVTVAQDDNNKGWKLDGATHTFEVDHSTTVEQIKQMLEVRVGLPPTLQKLKHAVKGFLKDKDSCAYYNFRGGDVIELTRQQRGGKKK